MNCILSNPYHRNKVVETGLFSDRMVKINKEIRMELFEGVFLKTFPISHSCFFGHPVVIKCEITIDKDDKMMKDAVLDFKKIFMVDDDQLEIRYSVINERRDVDTLPSWTSDELALQVMYKYEQMFPCSFILNMFNDDNASLDEKKVIVVPTVKAKESTIVMLEAIIQSIDPSSELARNKTTFKNYIDCIVDNLDEQCSSEYLPKVIEFKIIDNTRLCHVIPREIVMHLFENPIDPQHFDEMNLDYNNTGKSTLSGVIKSNDDYFIFTTGHYLNVNSRVVSEHYTLKDFMWPGSTRVEQIDRNIYFQCNTSEDLMQDSDAVSDVAVLEPSKVANYYFFGGTQFNPQKFISAYNVKRNPVLPKREQIQGTVQYIGYMSDGKMTIEGTAYIGSVAVYTAHDPLPH
jgi:hypothetical protein